MANNAYRNIQWLGIDKFAGVSGDPPFPIIGPEISDALLLDYRDNWGVGGFALNIRRPVGLGGQHRWTGNNAAIGAGTEWNLNRRLRDTNIVARCNALGLKVWFIVQCASSNFTAAYRGLWLDIFDDAAWANTILPELRDLAGAMETLGVAGVKWDWEDYNQQGGPTPPPGVSRQPTWNWDELYPGNPYTEAQVRAKSKQRGAEMTDAMYSVYPDIEMGAYSLRMQRGWNAWAGANSRLPVFLDHYNRYTNVDWLSGWFSTRQLKKFSFIDAMFYKTHQIYQGSWATGMKINHLSMMPWLATYPGFDWDWAASRLKVCAFTWIDPGVAPGEGLQGPSYVTDQLDQAQRWTDGGTDPGERFNYEHRWPNSDGTPENFDYGPYKPGMRAASTPQTVDSQPPSVTIQNHQTVGSNLNISGTSYDDMAIRRVHWRNTRTNAVGECRPVFVDLSGRPMNTTISGQERILGAFNTPNYTTWRIDWSCTVPLQLANDSIIITAVDIHGLTGVATVAGTDPIPPPPSAKPIVTANAASAAQTSAALSGTVDPEGSATDARFEYGPTTSYGTQTPVVSMGAGTTPVAISQTIAGLASGTLYHFRLTATNTPGTTVSADGVFTTASTPAPTVVSQAATVIGQSTASLSGTVNPQGLNTDARFEYGTTTSYGTQTPVQQMGAGTADVEIAQDLVGLNPDTLYHFRLTATNLAGTGASGDATFTTTAAPPAPSTGDRTGPYAAAVLNLPGLRGYWRLGELSGPALDSQGINTATPSGGATRGITGIPGTTNLGMSFDGVSGRISVPHATTLNLGDGPYSLMAWFKRSAIGSTDAIFDKGSGAYHLYIDADDKLKAGKADFSWGVESTVTITDTTTWHLVVVTYDGALWKLYLDGVDRSGSQSDLTVTDTTTPLGVGADLGGGAGNHFAGVLDELAVGAAVWSAQTATDLYALGTTPEQLSAVTGEVEQADTAQPVAVVQSGSAAAAAFGLRQATGGSDLRGVDRLRGATVVTTVVQIGQAEATDVAQSASSGSSRVLGQTFDNQTSVVLFRGLRSDLGQASETDSAQTQGYIYTIGQATETDEAPLQAVSGTPPLVPTRFRSLDFAVDTVVSIAAPKTTVSFTNQVLTAAITPHVLRSDDG